MPVIEAPFPPQETCLLPADSGLAVAVVIERHTCSCCPGERPDPGRDADGRAAARGGKTAPGWLPWLASCVARTGGGCAVTSSPASASVAVAGRSAARQVPAGQLRDQGRLPGLRPDRGHVAGAGQGARPQPGVPSRGSVIWPTPAQGGRTTGPPLPRPTWPTTRRRHTSTAHR